jgi:hypothetical protein
MIATGMRSAAFFLAGVCLLAGGARAQNPDDNLGGIDEPAEIASPIYIPPEEQNISGVWWTEIYRPELELIGGGEIPINEAGIARHAENRTALQNDPLSDEARKFCTPDGVPRIWASPYPFEIVQTPGYITMIYELNRVVRRIALNQAMPDEATLTNFPYYSGHSVGRWQGDILIVETAGYNDKTFLDATGLPHSNQLRTSERIRKLDDGRLEVAITTTDPVYYNRPFAARFVFDPRDDIRIQEYTCGKPHRDISHIEGVNAEGAQ